jgi:hypothetical protein
MAGHPTFGLAQRSNRWRRAGKMPDPAVTRLPDPNDSPLFTNRLNAKNETAFSLGQIESLRDWYDNGLSGQVKSESKWASKTGGSNSQESRVPE